MQDSSEGWIHSSRLPQRLCLPRTPTASSQVPLESGEGNQHITGGAVSSLSPLLSLAVGNSGLSICRVPALRGGAERVKVVD